VARAWWPPTTTASRWRPSMAARRACWFRTSTSGNRPSGSAGCVSWSTTSRASGSRSATTSTATPGASNGMTAIDQSAETTGRGLPWREVKVVETAPETPRATISFEFAHVAARADAKVIVLDRGERPLKAFDPELVAKLLERTRTLGVTLHPNAAVEAIERTTAGFRVQASVAGRAPGTQA